MGKSMVSGSDFPLNQSIDMWIHLIADLGLEKGYPFWPYVWSWILPDTIHIQPEDMFKSSVSSKKK